MTDETLQNAQLPVAAALIPPTPVPLLPRKPRPVLVTITAILMFVFSGVECLLAIGHGLAIAAMKSALTTSNQAQPLPPLPGLPPYTPPSLSHLLLLLRADTLLLALYIAFAFLFLLYGVALLQVYPGIRWRIIGGLIGRFIFGNIIFVYEQWCFAEAYHMSMDVVSPSIVAGVNLLFYVIAIVLLTRPSVRAAFAKPPQEEPIGPLPGAYRP